jgi:hypothetical protein
VTLTPEDITLKDLDNAPATIEGEKNEVDWAAFEKMRMAFVQVSEEKTTAVLENNKLKSDNRANDILNDLIEPFANKTFVFMCIYCTFVGLVLLMNSFGCFKQVISDDVLQILVGSTAVTVIGLVGMVLTGIFVGARRKHGA